MKSDFNNFILSLIVGLFTSLLSTIISTSNQITYFCITLIIISSFLYFILKFILPKVLFFKGIRILGNDSTKYKEKFSKSLENMENISIYKGLTGHEFFSNTKLRRCISSSKLHKIKMFQCFFSDPKSKAYENEVSTISDRKSLIKKHAVTREYLMKVISEIKERNKNVKIDIRYYDEYKNMINIVRVDDDVFLFIRGFDRIKDLGNQIVFFINMKKCNQVVKAIVNSIFEKYYTVFSHKSIKNNKNEST